VKRARESLLGPLLRLALPSAGRLHPSLIAVLLMIACSDRGLPLDSSVTLRSVGAESLARAEARRIAALQASAGPEHRVRELDANTWTASIPEQQLQTRFETGRVSLLAAQASKEPSTAVDLSAIAWGCVGDLQVIPAATPSASTERPGALEYRHAGFDEWYMPGPAGLEQGFTIHHLPDCAKHGEALQIQLALGNQATAASSEQDGEAVLTAPRGRAVHYGKAFAEDASGEERRVAIRTELGLRLEIDVRDAPLPIAIDPLAWVQQQTLTAGDGSAGDFFGKALAVSGDTLIVGAHGDDDHGTDSGSAYVFVRTSGAWTLQQKLTASDGAAGDNFGYAVALSGDTAVVGAYLADAGGVDAGAAYVFGRSGGTWSLQAKLVASDAVASDHLGAAVAISGRTLLVGAPLKKSANGNEAGAAYTFAQSGSIWAQQAKLVPSTGVGDHNGTGVAISGTTLALGTARAAGYAVSFFAFNGTSWVSSGNVTSSNLNLAYYGSALAMSGTYTVVGNYAHPLTPSGISGSVIVISNAQHNQQSTLRANDASANDLFGRAVAISDANTILVGSPQDDDQGSDSGSAYTFALNGSSWSQQQKLLAGDGKANDGFGSAVAISANAALLGAWQGGNPSGTGLVYAEYLAQTGAACSQSSECASGFCVESVCCASACSGTCQSCLQKNKGANGGADGVCGSVRADTDPRDSCPASPTGSCGPTGLCDGKGACSLPPVGTSCTFSECASATSSTLNGACNGSGECKPTATVPCQLGYACVAGTCSSGCHANSDCDGSLGYICTEQNVCKIPKGSACTSDVNCSTGTCQYGFCCFADAEGACIKPLGIQCGVGSECASGKCTDGVCCSSSACGTCASCAIAGSLGSCASLVTAPPDTPGQAACVGGGSGTAGSSADAGSAGLGFGGSAGLGQGGLTGDAGQPSQAGGAGNDSGGNGPAAGGAALSSSGNTNSSGDNNGSGNPGGSNAGSSANAGRAGSVSQVGAGCLTDAECASGLGCHPESHTCQDLLVQACGCRVAGERPGSDSRLGVLALALVAGVVRRRRRVNP